ncbi:MAG TPA: MogA/MoaB family molybdenum cofactor biosynthesis protein [Mycobacteriales bacterium]|jgi:molybdenum cofactor synthesis domain-containing protein|nr:MogA/MoaB family molybdenum cofactor biosynthesis protein [Mycobacteriales bacterium]
MRAVVLTVSDRAVAGTRTDESGPLAAELLTAQGFDVTQQLAPDDTSAITKALRAAIGSGADLVITTGGTGLAPRDVTPEATMALIDRPADGIADLIRRAGSVPTAALSRGVAGVTERTLIINLAGSTGAVRDGIAALEPLLAHAVSQLAGGDH